jgi:hypothetical protein
MSEPIQPSSTFANWIGAFIVVFLCATMSYLTYIVTTSSLSDNALNIVIYILGFLTGKLSTIVDWSFGTTSSSKKKDDTIAVQAQAAAVAQDKLAPLPGAPDKTVHQAPGEATVVKADAPNAGT